MRGGQLILRLTPLGVDISNAYRLGFLCDFFNAVANALFNEFGTQLHA